MDEDRRQELIGWAKESLAPIRTMAEGKPFDRAEVLQAVRQFMAVLGETGILEERGYPAAGVVRQRARITMSGCSA